MKNIKVDYKEKMSMALVHYFIVEEGYVPVVVKGSSNEMWLENLQRDYKIIRINSNYIHNADQFEYDVMKVKHVVKQIRKKTMSFKLTTLNINLNVRDNTLLHEDDVVTSLIADDIDVLKENKILCDNFSNISETLMFKDDDMDQLITVTEDLNKATDENNRLFESVFSDKKLVFTNVIIAICVIMYLFMTLFTDGSTNAHVLLEYGANNLLLVLNGDLYRVVTSIFLHFGFIHLFLNMYSLYLIGSQVETVLGKYKFLGIYLVSGISGSLMSLILNDDTVVSVGASGAIFGLMGALLYFGYYYRLYLNRTLFTEIVPVIMLNLVIGFTFDGIDNFAHIGGLIGGYLSAIAFGLTGKSDKKEMFNGLVALVLFIGFLTFMVFK